MDRKKLRKLGLDPQVVSILISEYVEGACNCVMCRETRFKSNVWELMHHVKNPLPFLPRMLDASEDYAFGNRKYDWRTRYEKIVGMVEELKKIHLFNYRKVANYKRYGSEFTYCVDCGHAFKQADEGGKIDFTTHHPIGREHVCDVIEGYVCDHCLKRYAFCPDCKRWHYKHAIRIVNFDTHAQHQRSRYGTPIPDDVFERRICRNCYEETYQDCDKCGISVLKENGHHYSDSGLMAYSNAERYLCLECHNSHKDICGSCGDTIYTFAHKVDTEGKKVCGACYNRGIAIHDYAFKPPAVIRTSKKNTKISDDTLLFGVELEVENMMRYKVNGTPRTAMAHRFLLTMGRDKWYIKNDSSLTDGIEIVTHPFSWQQFKEDKKDWEKMLKLFREFHWGASKNCGIHVHMSKAAFTTLHIYKFIRFIYEDMNREFMYAIAERSKDPQCNDYCRYYEKDEEKMSLTAKAKSNASGERHSAVSLLYPPTVEVRIFQSSTVDSKFFKNLEFCQSLFEYSMNNKIQDMVAYKYVLYLLKHRNQYRHLVDFIIQNEHIHSHYSVIENVLNQKGV